MQSKTKILPTPESTLQLFNLLSQVDDNETLISRLLKGQIVDTEDKDLIALYAFFNKVKGKKTEAIGNFVKYLTDEPPLLSAKKLFDLVELLIKKEMQVNIDTALRGDTSLAKAFCRAEIMRDSSEAQAAFAQIDELVFEAGVENVAVQASTLSEQDKIKKKNSLLTKLGEDVAVLLIPILPEALKWHINNQMIPVLEKHYADKNKEDIDFNIVRYFFFNFMLVSLNKTSMSEDREPVWQTIYRCVVDAKEYCPSDALSETSQHRLDMFIRYLNKLQAALIVERDLNHKVNDARQISNEQAESLLANYAEWKRRKNELYAWVGKKSNGSDDSINVLNILRDEKSSATDKFNAVAEYMNAKDEKDKLVNKSRDLFVVIEKQFGRGAFTNKQMLGDAKVSRPASHFG